MRCCAPSNRKQAKCEHIALILYMHSLVACLATANRQSANISSICPPSSRVSPFCLRQSPTGRDTLTARTLGGVASLCHSLRWCKKSQRTRNFVQILVLGVRFGRRHCSSNSVFERVSAFIRTHRTSKVRIASHHNCEQSEQYHLP